MKIFKNIFISAFLICCLVPSILLTAGYKNPNRENRPLSKMPELIKDGGLNTGFAEGFDKYVSEHFALREGLINAFNTVDSALLKDYNGQNAVIGKANHIFYAETVDDYLGIDLLTDEELESAANYLLFVQTMLKERGVLFAFMTAPNKATVYPEYMPDYLIPTDAEGNMERLTALLTEKGVNVIDAKRVLLDGKMNRSVYYEHDSHWNNYGAMLVYNTIAESFGLEKYDAETYTVEYDRTGDLHYFVYPTTEYYEERIIYPEFHAYTSKRPIDFDRDKEINTESGVNTLSMLVYHDSFGRSLQPLLSQSVGSLMMNAYFPYDLKTIEDNEPKIVLIELVERNLDKLAQHAISLGY